MSEQTIEQFIGEVLVGEAQKNAGEFVAYLRANEMQFEKAGGYWEDKLYWAIGYRDKSVCFIELKDDPSGPWTVWSDDSGSDSFGDSSLDEHIKEIFWGNVVVCENINPCFNGCKKSRKKIFGKDIDNVCGTAVKFENPNAEAVACLKRMAEIRKNRILRNG
ncbi:MAG: hypothetical protein FWG93_02065 [Oscillospiraceae bacterium]|nr:hypothetical protein [Oscillospiraceae bacterium]